MPTKEELLEEKTVKELRQMAKDKSVPGYYSMRKEDLIDKLSDKYLKDEIKEWPQLGIKEIVPEKKSPTVKEEPEEVEEDVQSEEVEIDEGFGSGLDPVFSLAVLGAAVAMIFVIVAILFQIY